MQMALHRILLLATAGCLVSSGQTIPTQYQEVYTTLNTQISSFSSTVNSLWNGSRSGVVYAPQLESASSAQYTGLLATGYYSGVVIPELNELQALGATGVKVQVSFPILYAPFYGTDTSLYDQMAAFYEQLAKDIKARGLQLIVESTVENQFPGDNAAGFTAYYQTLSWTQYMAARAANAVVTADLMQPNYMSLVTEPDSEESYTGQTNVLTVSGATDLLETMLGTLKAEGITGVSYGAGTGTWMASFSQYLQSFAATSIQYVDVHVYILNDNYLMDAFTAAGVAQAAGKPIAMSGIGDFKLANSEVGTLTLTQTNARDPFSFWQPIDTAFLQAMSDFANYEHALFISPFYDQYFFAYLNYTNFGSTPIGPLVIDSQAAAAYGELTGASTLTGQAWLALSDPVPDTTPPATPAPPVAVDIFATSSILNWTATTDNVGVAAYNLYRNGTLVTTTSLLTYSDEGLLPVTAYSYTLTAVDAYGNVSLPSTPLLVVTVSAIPPTVPGMFQSTAATISQINLSWNASTSIVGVSGYDLYRGPSPFNLTSYAKIVAPTTSYIDTQVGPSLTYYYALFAYDTLGNQSSLTAPIAVTTPVETAPTTPGLPVATPLAYNQVNLTWPASTSVLSIGGYLIFRGTSPSTLAQISYTFVPLFIDQYASPSTTYYYAVTAFDIDGLDSGQSATVSATTPRETAPTPPVLTGQANAYNTVALSWSASTSVAGVGGYVVYRGTSPTTLSAIAQVKSGLVYTDTTAIPSTTYSYAVLAYDTYGLYSPQSNVLTIVTPKEPAPSAPSMLMVQALAANDVSLSWTASSSPVGLWGYVVYRGASPTTLAAIGESKTTTTYSDTTTAAGTTYYYAVLAYDTYGEASAQSAAMSVTTPKASGPTAPSKLMVQALAYNDVSLSWTASSSSVGIWGYVIYRGASASSLAVIGESRTTTTYTDATTAPSTTYYYAVLAYDNDGNASPQSSVVSVTTPKEPAPSVPTQLGAQALAYNDVVLSWMASTSPVGISTYVVYRGASASTLTAIGTSKTTGYTDTTTAPSTTYYYAVAAEDIYGLASAQTAAIPVVTPKEPAPSVPTGLNAPTVTATSVGLSWNASTSGVGIGGYVVYRGATSTSLSAMGSSKTATYTDSTVKASTTYYYSVAAYDVYGVTSAQSAAIPVTTP